ncbi:hypothetical protein [Shimazuella soli]|uniref:hypothetical protein n=1 Tax=Shimazuella soli TaxID=1892854 RepID=UPI001F0D3A74|nr:hypothetical protein [Shimazuella soli]
MENRSTPLEVTNSLQEITDEFGYTADQMHVYKQQIVDLLDESGKGYIAKFLFPDGLDEDERWIHALICMEIRRLYFLTRGDEHGFTVHGRRMHRKGK